jgi:hypothetical protein
MIDHKLKRQIEKHDRNVRINNAMEVLVKEMNIGDGTEVGFQMGVSLACQHPTLQQVFMGAVLKLIETHGMKDYADARNKASVNWARELSKSEFSNGFPFI